MMRRHLALRLLGAGAAAGTAAVATALAGGSPDDLAVAAAAAALVVAGLLLAPGASSGPPWSPREVGERTSAGWHDVRLLADAMARASRDVAVRTTVTARIRGALGLPPLGGPASRRDLDRALGALMTTGAGALTRERP